MRNHYKTLETLIDQVTEAMTSHDTGLWDTETVIDLLKNMLDYLQKPNVQQRLLQKRNLVAFYNFTPKHCPNCGTKIVWSGETLMKLIFKKEEYQEGNQARCPVCDLTHQRLEMEI